MHPVLAQGPVVGQSPSAAQDVPGLVMIIGSSAGIQCPAASHCEVMQASASKEQDIVLGLKQLLASSLQRLLHSAPPTHGSPEWTHVPLLHVSVPLQNTPSLHGAV